MDPFRYHDTNELGTFRGEIQFSNCPQMVIVTSKDSGSGISWSPVVTVPLNPSSPRPILGSNSSRSSGAMSQSAPPYLWNRENSGLHNFAMELSSSVASSPPLTSSSVSPPSSVFESARCRPSYSRASSMVSEQSFDGSKGCSFCKKNGEQPRIFNAHQLAVFVNGRRVVECPVLRSVRCQVCGATGDEAHTISHCPYSSRNVPVALVLKNTPRRCDGSLRRRYMH